MPINGPAPNPFGDTYVRVRGAAYANSAPGPAPITTLLYDIDPAPSALYLQLPPNDGKLVPVGAIGRALSQFGFDIYQDTSRRNRGLVLTPTSFIEIDLAGGAAVSVRAADFRDFGELRDVAVLP